MKKIMLFLSLNLFNQVLISANQTDLVKALELIKLRKYSSKSIKVFIGFVDLIDGAERLVDEQNTNPIQDLQRLMEGVTNLVGASMSEAMINDSEQSNISQIIDDFKLQIYLLQNIVIKAGVDHDGERQKLIEGLAAILYNAVYILIDPKSMKSCLSNILSGVYKVVSAILADGKVDRTDWALLLHALASIFNLSNMRTGLLNQSINHSVTAI